MARDPAGTYSYPPGIEGAPDQTIESVDYNAFLFDIQADLNLPRPIVAGGTGASTAVQAMSNLNGEIAAQLVDNYNSFPFQAGSFYSVGGATGEPVTGHSFIGICYLKDASNIVLEARDESDTLVPGRRYVREKKTGTWSAWKTDGLATVDHGGGDITTGIASDAADMFFGLRGTAPTSYFTVNTESDVSGTDAIKVNKNGTVVFTGAVTIPAGATDPAGLVTKAYVDAADTANTTNANSRVLKAGDTMSGPLTVNAALNTNTPAGGAVGTEVTTAAWVRTYAQPKDAQLFAGIPMNNSSSYTTVATDAQKCICGTGTITINSALYPVGTVITFAGYTGTMTITCSGNTIYWIGPSGLTSGNRTLPDRGIATAVRTPDGNWIIGGTGMT